MKDMVEEELSENEEANRSIFLTVQDKMDDLTFVQDYAAKLPLLL